MVDVWIQEFPPIHGLGKNNGHEGHGVFLFFVLLPFLLLLFRFGKRVSCHLHQVDNVPYIALGNGHVVDFMDL
jgi:hypothetical protein